MCYDVGVENFENTHIKCSFFHSVRNPSQDCSWKCHVPNCTPWSQGLGLRERVTRSSWLLSWVTHWLL